MASGTIFATVCLTRAGAGWQVGHLNGDILMKFISAVLSAMAMAVALPVSTAQAQGYYSAPIFSAGGAVSLGVIGPRPHYSKSHAPTYYQQPQYVVRRTLKPIWALGQPVSLGNPTGNAEISIYRRCKFKLDDLVPLAQFVILVVVVLDG